VTEVVGLSIRPNIARKLANLDSNRLQMDRMLSAQQIRAARGLLGWSRRELAIVAGISQGTIKAIEQGTTDARLSTLRKLARTFTAHRVEFVAEGPWTGVLIRNRVDADRAQPSRTAHRAKPTVNSPGHDDAEQSREDNERSTEGNDLSPKVKGFQWLRTLVRAAQQKL
jgi:transcriptional regulator with XRE-family HTH domain